MWSFVCTTYQLFGPYSNTESLTMCDSYAVNAYKYMVQRLGHCIHRRHNMLSCFEIANGLILLQFVVTYIQKYSYVKYTVIQSTIHSSC